MSVKNIEEILAKTTYETGENQNNYCNLLCKKGSEIQSKPINWLWKGLIARGKIMMIAGNPGIGKSQLTANLAAIVSDGKPWPHSQEPCNIGAVIILSAEDDAEDTIIPRLQAAGANLENIYIIEASLDEKGNERTFNLMSDLTRLDALLGELKNVSMIIIDPITAYLGNTDSYKNAEVRSLLSPLAKIAAKHNTAVVCVSHLTKDVNKKALLRIAGSLAFVAAARAAFVVIEDEDDTSKRLFLPIKNNIGNDKTGFSFIITPKLIDEQIETTAIEWTRDVVTKTADQLMGENNHSSSLAEAKEFLLELLQEGEMPAKDVVTAAENEGISIITLKRAKKDLGIKSCKQKGKKGNFIWKLPSKEVTHLQNYDSRDHDDLLKQHVHEDHEDQIYLSKK